MSRLRAESGIAVPTAIIVMMVLLLLGLAATQAALGGLSQASRDRNVKRALGAADAGADVAQWRMNHTLLAFDGGLLDLANLNLTVQNVLEQTCLTVNALDTDLLSTTAPVTDFNPILIQPLNLSWCQEKAEADGESLGDGASYTYRASSGIRVLSGSTPIGIRRKVLVKGKSGGVRRRILVALDLRLASGGSILPDSLFKRTGWVECTATPPAGSSAPDAGCPNLPPFDLPDAS